MWGFRDQFLKQVEGRNGYFLSLYTPFNYTDKELYGRLSAGYVNDVVVQKKYRDVLAYFTGSEYFKTASEDKNFVTFSLNPPPSYLELDGKPIASNVTKGNNVIIAQFACLPGRLTIKESYDKWWNAKLDGEPVRLSPGKYGFSTLEIAKNGNCKLEMDYSMPFSYNAFYLVSLLALAGCSWFYVRH